MPSPTYRAPIGYRAPYSYRGAPTGAPPPSTGTGLPYRNPYPYRTSRYTYEGLRTGHHFFCPTDQIVPPIYIDPPDPYYPCDPLMQRLMAHYENQWRGRNVFLLSDGSYTEQQPPNWNPDDPDEPYATVFDASSGEVVVTYFTPDPYVVKVYFGGVDNEITAAEAAALNAAGYVTT